MEKVIGNGFCVISLIARWHIFAVSLFPLAADAMLMGTAICPLTKQQWDEKAIVLNCSGGFKFTCILNEKNTYVEGCVPPYPIDSNITNCPFFISTAEGLPNVHHFTECNTAWEGCPPAHHEGYTVAELWKYPLCLVRVEEREPTLTGTTKATSSAIPKEIQRQHSDLLLAIIVPTTVILTMILIVVGLVIWKNRRDCNGKDTEDTTSMEFQSIITEETPLVIVQFKMHGADYTTIKQHPNIESKITIAIAKAADIKRHRISNLLLIKGSVVVKFELSRADGLSEPSLPSALKNLQRHIDDETLAVPIYLNITLQAEKGSLLFEERKDPPCFVGNEEGKVHREGQLSEIFNQLYRAIIHAADIIRPSPSPRDDDMEIIITNSYEESSEGNTPTGFEMHDNSGFELL